MSRYKPFDDEINTAKVNETDILPELDVDEPHQLEFKLQLRNHRSTTVSSTNKYNLNRLKICLSRRTRLERCLIPTNVILLFGICLSSLIWFDHHHSKQRSEQVCLTSTCIQVSSSILSGMNQTVNPCDDFHEFVCGRWIKTHVIPKGHSGWSTTEELSKKNLIILKSILERTKINDSLSIFNVEKEAIKLYQSCMNISEIEKRELQPLEIFVKDTFNLTLNQWIHLNQSETWPKLFISSTGILSKKYGLSYLLPITIGPDDRNSTWNVIHVSEIIFKNFFYACCSYV